MKAAADGNEDVVIAAAGQGVHLQGPETYSSNSMAPIVAAAGSGQLYVVMLLLALGVPVDGGGGNHETTPLEAAVKKGQLHVVMLLIERGADVHARDENGASLIYHGKQLIHYPRFNVALSLVVFLY